MNVICLEDAAFYELVEKVVSRLKADLTIRDKWISSEEAMRMLRITSPTTLQKLRDEAAIRFSQPAKKMILYDINSIEEYLAKHAK